MSPAQRITAAFQHRQSQQQMAFIPFVTAGDPDLETTSQLLRVLAGAGADLIEIGFPYSDPIADGPVIQSSYTRALNQKIRLKDIFAAVQRVSGDFSTPLVAMVSYAIIFRFGSEAFVKTAADAGFCGLIVPDLPGDEAAEFATLTDQAGLALIQLVAPTTPEARLDKILAHASGFVYCIAVAGTTGAREALPSELAEMLGNLRRKTKLPLAVGFGVSRPDQVQNLRGVADGAIVGSALVKCLAPDDSQSTVEMGVERLRQLAVDLAAAAHPTGG